MDARLQPARPDAAVLTWRWPRPSLTEWQGRRTLLEAIGDADARAEIAVASQRLLRVVERLTDRYEQAMQMLIGDRIGRMACSRRAEPSACLVRRQR